MKKFYSRILKKFWFVIDSDTNSLNRWPSLIHEHNFVIIISVIYLASTLMVLDLLWEVPDAHALVYWPRPTGRTSHFTIYIVEVISISNKGICPVFYSVLLSRTLAKDITISKFCLTSSISFYKNLGETFCS